MTLLPSDVVDGDATTGTEAAQEAVESHAAAEGAEDAAESAGGIGSRQGLREALLSTDPAPPLQAVESPWNPDLGGATRILRAFQKMTGADGLPAGADLIIGIGEMVVAFEPDGGDEAGDGDGPRGEQRDDDARGSPTEGSTGLSPDELEAAT
jgi:hypothetical protein